MSINGVSGITGFGGLGPADRSALPAASATMAAAPAPPTSDDTAQQAAPARFPWLSRLSRQLESAADQPAAFAAAPELGDYLDRSA